MLPQHLQGVVGFSEPTATLLCHWLPGDGRVSPERARSTVPEIRRLFRGSGKVQKGRAPASRHAFTSLALPPVTRKAHSGIRVRRFVECILEEIPLFPVARTGLGERIRASAAGDYSRGLGEQ